MKTTNKIIETIFKISGIFIMIPIMFYLHIYEIKPFYQPQSN